MKHFKFLAMALAAFTIASCSNEEAIQDGPSKPGEKANLVVKITGSGTLARAAEATEEEQTVKDYIVFLFREDGALDAPAKAQTGSGNLLITGATTAAKTVYVIANTGALADGIFKDVTTEAGLKKVVGKLMTSADVNTSTQLSDNLWMEGSQNIEFGTGDQATVATPTVALSFLSAKVQLFVEDARTNNDAANDISIADNEIVLLYAGRDGKFFETDANKAVQTNYYTGDIAYRSSYDEAQKPIPDNTLESTALKYDIPVAGLPKTPASDLVTSFYTFGNDATGTSAHPTILAIKSTKTVKGVESTVYYPIQFTTADAKNTIVPGKLYKVSMKLTGDVNEGGGGGVIDPEEPVLPGDVTVTVTTADWELKEITKEFN